MRVRLKTQNKRNAGGNVRRRVGGSDRPVSPGRPKGVPNKYTRIIKTAVLLAAERVGEDGQGKAGVVGYLMNIARNEPVAFCGLLGKLMPIQLTGDAAQPVRVLAEGMTPHEAALSYAETLKAVAATPVIDVQAPAVEQPRIEKQPNGIELIEDAEYEDVSNDK